MYILLQKSSALSFLESTKTDLENEYQTLLHNFDVHKSRVRNYKI